MRHHPVASCLIVAGFFLADPAACATRPDLDPSVGAAAYQQYCARCHGPEGRGDGFDAKRLYPRPRDLTEGVFKFRSTATGTAPTDEDLFKTLTDGLPGTGMPDWSHLDEGLRWQLVAYLKSLSTAFTDTPPEPVAVGTDPGLKRADRAKGRAVYEQLGCAACHGVGGRGNGPSAATLVDNWGRPTRPKDLTEGWSYRGGNRPADIVTRILAGIDGTPMPSYAEAVSTDDAWQLAYYVRALQQDIPSTMIAQARRIEGPLPEDPDDPRWQEAPRADARLRDAVDTQGQINAPQTVTRLSLWVLHNGEALALRVMWNDVSEDRGEPSDALAVALLRQGFAEASPKLEERRRALLPQGLGGDMVSLQTWPLRSTPALDLCLWQATPPAEAREAVVNDFDKLFNGTSSGVMRASRATYLDGEWTVVITRPLSPTDVPDLGASPRDFSPRIPSASEGQAAQLADRAVVPMGFVVWDGGNPGQRAVSMWIDVVLRPPKTHESGHHAAQPKNGRHSSWLVWGVATVVLITGLALVIKTR